MNMRPHQGDIAVPQLDGGLRVMTLDEQREQRKKKGLCTTCGEVQTHKNGIWKSMMPEVSPPMLYGAQDVRYFLFATFPTD